MPYLTTLSIHLTEPGTMLKSTNPFLLVLFAVFTVLFAPVRASAAEPVLFVGTTFHSILETGPEGTPQGVAVDLLNRISKMTGDEFDIQIKPWRRAMEMVRDGKATGLIGPYKSPEREEFLTYTDTHIYEDRMVFLSRKGACKTRWNGDLNTLHSIKILAVGGWDYGPDFKALQNAHPAEIIASASTAVGMLANNRAELLAFNERNGLAEIRIQGVQDLIEVCEPHFASKQGYYAFTHQGYDEELFTRFNSALTKLLDDGTIRQFNQKHGLAFVGQ